MRQEAPDHRRKTCQRRGRTLQLVGKTRAQILPRASANPTMPCSQPVRLGQDSHLQKGNIVIWCCSESLSLWSFVRAANIKRIYFLSRTIFLVFKNNL